MVSMSWLLKLPPAQQKAYFEGPALKPPPGVKPNFVDPPNQNTMGYAVLSTQASIVAILVVVQMYSRIVYHRKITIADCKFRSKGNR